MPQIDNLPYKKDFRRKLRANQTEAERKIWGYLRDGRLSGFKFYRQYSLGEYVVDFYCAKCKLAIELDGSQHSEYQEYDKSRTAWLSNHGVTTLRFWDNEALKYPKQVCEVILSKLY